MNVHRYRNHTDVVIWDDSEELVRVTDRGLIVLHIPMGTRLAMGGYCDLIDALAEARRVAIEYTRDKPSETLQWYPDLDCQQLRDQLSADEER